MISIIASVGKNLEIGRGGDLAFRGKGELGYFKDTTMGHKVLMGRKTFESLPRRLNGREYFVISRGGEFPEWVTVVGNVTTFFEQWQDNTEEIFVIGGGSVYAMALPYAKKLYLTEIDADCSEADVFFPEFVRSEYEKEKVGEGAFDDGLTFARFVYTKK